MQLKHHRMTQAKLDTSFEAIFARMEDTGCCVPGEGGVRKDTRTLCVPVPSRDSLLWIQNRPEPASDAIYLWCHRPRRPIGGSRAH